MVKIAHVRKFSCLFKYPSNLFCSLVQGDGYLRHSEITYHGAGRYRIPLQPERNEGRGDQDYSRYKNGGEVKRSVPREYQVHLQAAVVS